LIKPLPRRGIRLYAGAPAFEKVRKGRQRPIHGGSKGREPRGEARVRANKSPDNNKKGKTEKRKGTGKK